MHAFLMVIPNTIMKVKHFEIFPHFPTFLGCRLQKMVVYKVLTPAWSVAVLALSFLLHILPNKNSIIKAWPPGDAVILNLNLNHVPELKCNYIYISKHLQTVFCIYDIPKFSMILSLFSN